MIEIPEKLDEKMTMFGRISCDCDDCDELYECELDVTNSEYPIKDMNDYRHIVIEVAHVNTNNMGWQWTYDIIYNAYGDNHYTSDGGKVPCGTGYATCEDAMLTAIRAYNSSVYDIKKFVADVDNYYDEELDEKEHEHEVPWDYTGHFDKEE